MSNTNASDMVIDKTSAPIANFTLANTSTLDRISRNFIIGDLVRSETATRNGIINWFAVDEHLRNAVYLCRQILQPVYAQLGAYRPNSVYRNQDTERALKSKPKSWLSSSQHAFGQAADIEIAGMPNLALAEYLRDNFETDQIILELYDPMQGQNSGWVHVSVTQDKNRRQQLSYIKRAGGFVYAPGFVTT